MACRPPYTPTPASVSLVAEIAEAMGRLSALEDDGLRLRRMNRIHSIHGSLAIEGNSNSSTPSPMGTGAWGGCGRR